MELLVVGAGTMGRWVARTVDAEVAFADVDAAAAEDAAEAVGGRAVPVDGDERFDAVCIAVPMSAVAGAIEGQAHRAREAVFDVAGEMRGPLDAMAEHAPDRERVSLHPLFAPEAAPGNVAVVRDADGPTVEAILADLAAAGNELVETTPEAHDEAMESVQAAAHAAVLAYGLATESVPTGFSTPVSATLDELVDRVGGNDPGVYAEIQDAFDGADAVAEAAERIAAADSEALEELVRVAEPAEAAFDPYDAADVPGDAHAHDEAEELEDRGGSATTDPTSPPEDDA